MSDRSYNFWLGSFCVFSLFLFIIVNDIVAMHLFNETVGTAWCAVSGFISAFIIIEFYRRKKRQA